MYFYRSGLPLLIYLLGIIISSCTHNSIDNNKKNPAPGEFRFKKTTLSIDLVDPMDMAIDAGGKIYITERKGHLKLYDPADRKLKEIARLTVDSNSWDGGLKGIALDPDFESNRWIYLFTAPYPEKGTQRVSRFTMGTEKLNMKSEKVIIEFHAERERHLGGSLFFDSKGNLFISSGDNTNPEVYAYAPQDERPDHLKSDAQRSSGNTNDMRGKILRIHPTPSGDYTIPKGNLFEKADSLTRPEIYIMGTRNAFKATYDDKQDILYWGDIGPDAGADSEFGPQGYDEINRATKAGNYGWPYFIGNNLPYRKVDFANMSIGKSFNSQKPINNSPNNSGKNILPPAQKSWISYPYSISKEYPSFRSGGRSIMTGPIYRYKYSIKSPNRFPKWFDNKLFIYDWMRNWIMTLEEDGNGVIKKIETFMPSTFFNRPIDLDFGPDGCLYILEYGNNWMNNTDSKFVKIEYLEGNLSPVAVVSADKVIGATPLTVKFKGNASYDPDKGKTQLRYEWSFTSAKVQSNESNPTFVFTSPGTYIARLTVIDPKGKSDYTDLEIKVGNTAPEVSVEMNTTGFFWNNFQLPYKIKVVDKEDANIDPSAIKLTLKYDPDGMENLLDTISLGQKLISKSDCKGCHSMAKKSTGPSFIEIASRYKGQKNKISFLANKIISGGSGNWGENHMSAHPQIEYAQSKKMVKYILSLSNPDLNLQQQGVLNFKTDAEKDSNATYNLIARYTDKGTSYTGSITTTKIFQFKSPLFFAKNYNEAKDHIMVGELFSFPFQGTFLTYKNINLENVSAISLDYYYGSFPDKSTFEIRIDSPKGMLLGSANVPSGIGKQFKIPITQVKGMHTLYFIYNQNPAINSPVLVNTIYFHKK